MDFIFIPYNTPSLKNGKIKGRNGIFHSKTVKKYLTLLGIKSYSSRKKEVVHFKNVEPIILKLKSKFEILKDKEKPYEFGFHFVRNSKRKFDFNNANQIIADLLVAYDIIDGDDMSEFIPYAFKINNSFYSVDKNNPGVYIKI